jgi:hypothetical protein
MITKMLRREFYANEHKRIKKADSRSFAMIRG